MKVELNAWQVAMLESLVQRELSRFPFDQSSAYVKSLGGLLNVLTVASCCTYHRSGGDKTLSCGGDRK